VTPTAARDDDPGEIEAQIDAESVQIIMRQHKADVRACYNQGLKANPDASGTIEVRFAINAQGHAVKRRVLSDTVGLPGVGDCILGQLGRWQFPRPVGGEVEFVYPFILSPGR
jgi:Ca-activated chloride channel homolog